LRATTDALEPTSWLLLCPREDELETLWRAGEHDLARAELETFRRLHPDNPRVQLLHARAEARVCALEGRTDHAARLLERCCSQALELGFVLQAREARRQLVGLGSVTKTLEDKVKR
jgi:hypothetical protein